MIGGCTAPKGSRDEFGALLLGYHDDGEFRYAGKVGTGFDRAPLRDLAPGMRALRPRRRRRSPTPRDPRARRTWVEPELVAEVGVHASGRATAACATRASSACATTRPRREVVRER